MKYFQSYNRLMITIHSKLVEGRERTYIYSKNDFFRGKLIIKQFDDRIEFIKPTPCYNGRTYNFTKMGQCVICESILPVGNYEYTVENDKAIIEL